MPVSLVISDTKLKVLELSDKRVARGMTLDIPEEAIKDGLIVKPEIVAELLKSVFSLLNIPGKNISAALSGISFIYRILRLPKVKNKILREAVERATQKEINLPLEELYIDWQIVAQTQDEITVFVMGMPRTHVDALLLTSSMAKIQISSIEHRTLSLSRAVGLLDYALIEANDDNFDIIIVSWGLPVTLHSVKPKNIHLTLEDKLSQLSDELNRTIDYFNITHKDSCISPDSHIYVSGSLIDDIKDENLITALGFPLERVDPPIALPEKLETNLYLANIGLLLNNSVTKPAAHVEGYADISVNLVLAKIRDLKRKVPVKKIFAYAAVAISVLLIIPLNMIKTNIDVRTNELKVALKNADLFLIEEQNNAEEALLIMDNIEFLEKEIGALKKEIVAIKGNGKVSESVEFINSLLPVGADISAITVDLDKIFVEGQAAGKYDVIEYIQELNKSGYFAEVRLVYIDETMLIENTYDNPIVYFGIIVIR